MGRTQFPRWEDSSHGLSLSRLLTGVARAACAYGAHIAFAYTPKVTS